MKNIIILLVFIIGYNTTNAQQIKELKYFDTDSNKYNPSDLDLNRVYYKDIYNYFTPFLGQWKYTNGNQTFIVTLWKETKRPTSKNDEILFYCDEIFGHYAMYQDYGLPRQTLLYTSQTNIGTTNQTWETILFSDSTVSRELSGIIHDIFATPLNPTEYAQGLSGHLTIKINNSTSPLTASWSISNGEDLFRPNQPGNFTIPTNIILTKI